jgi:hypothetical protein
MREYLPKTPPPPPPPPPAPVGILSCVAVGDRAYRLRAGRRIDDRPLEMVGFEVDAGGAALAQLEDGPPWPAEELEPDVAAFDPDESF